MGKMLITEEQEEPKKKKTNKKELNTEEEIYEEAPIKRKTKKKKNKYIKDEYDYYEDYEEKSKFTIKSEHILLLIFIVLVIVVIALSVTVIKQKNEPIKEKNDTINLLESDMTNEITITPKDIKENEYIFDIVNYTNNKVSKEKINYNIEIKNDTSSSIKVEQNQDNAVVVNQKGNYVLDNNILEAKKEELDSYRIIITNKEKILEDEKITIIIVS